MTIENSIVARRDVFPSRVISKPTKLQPAAAPQNAILVFLMKLALLVKKRMISLKMENVTIKFDTISLFGLLFSLQELSLQLFFY